jgi:hypothetical protein
VRNNPNPIFDVQLLLAEVGTQVASRRLSQRNLSILTKIPHTCIAQHLKPNRMENMSVEYAARYMLWLERHDITAYIKPEFFWKGP